MISHADAMSRLVAALPSPKGYENIPISRAAGRVTARPIVSIHPSPRYPTAAMDGYAIRAADIGRTALRMVDALPAGSEATRTLGEGECIKTFTGSMMSDGSDTLVPIEYVLAEGDQITLIHDVAPGFAVRRIGEDYNAGETLIPAGTPLSFAHIGMLAALGRAMIGVVTPPVVSIVATGSEILDLGDESANPSQIRSANNYMLEALAVQNGAQVRQLGVTGDDKETIRRTMEQALAQSDIVVTTGGVSVGDYDFVKEVILEWPDAQLLFKGVAIKPGQHVTVARLGDKYFFGLPGFSYSAAVTFFLYVVPVIRAFLGLSPDLPVRQARLASPYPKKHPKTEFAACRLTYRDGSYYASFDGMRRTTSANIVNLLDPSTALIVLPAETADPGEGESVDVLLFPGTTPKEIA